MKTPRLLPPLVADIVKTALSAVEGVTFTRHSICPVCGGSLVGYDTRKKQFAHLLTDDGTRNMYVDIRRFSCGSCHQFTLADNPFYPDTKIGSVIVDLCIALSMTIPVNHVPEYLAFMGIHVDRSSCRLYTQHICSCHVRINTRYLDINNKFGIHLPLSVLSLSNLATDNGREDHIDEAAILEACGFPSAPRKARNFPLPQKRWINRDDIGI